MRCTGLIAVALVCLTPVVAAAQGQRKDNAPNGPAPKMPDGKPDFSGVWNPTNFIAIGQPSLTPWADALYKERRANLSKDDPEGHCLPAGVPRNFSVPHEAGADGDSGGHAR